MSDPALKTAQVETAVSDLAIWWLGLLVMAEWRYGPLPYSDQVTLCAECGQLRPVVGDCPACEDPVF